MLSPSRDEDDEEDNHLCIKCNATIIGLDNYVKHRREGCSKRKYQTDLKARTTKNDEVASISTLDPSCSLGADVFFQSLELQSSSKKNTLQSITPPIRVLRHTSKSTSTSTRLPRRVSPGPGQRGQDWIGGHSLRIVGNEDNQTKLIKAVANISGTAKKDLSSSTYNIATFNDFKPDEESNEDSEDSEDDEDDDQPQTGGKWKPSPGYTGGKWKPEGPEAIHHWSTQLVIPEPDDWDIREEHTGGKWKPGMRQADKSVPEEDRDEDYDVPPPGHTKGKWVPGATQVDKTQIIQPRIHNKGSVQYWCGPCNRRLGSRAIYEKHLMSNLHLKKTLPENDLEFSGHMRPTRISIGKRSLRPSIYLNPSLYTQGQRKRLKTVASEASKLPGQKKIRTRRPYYVQCPGCKSRVRTYFMGKHLISHYHFRKTNLTGDAYQKLILDNIVAIVHQSPFQCSPCKFYTNWLSTFMKHWISEEHAQKFDSIEGKIWCSFCKFECDSSDEMLQHISSNEHSEVVSVINRSMPIIIRKKTMFSCEVCKMEFRYNIELKYHAKNTGHYLSITASDGYQELHKCQFCDVRFKSSLSLAAHLKRKHHQNVFFCLRCGLTFKSSEDAKRHRKSQQHRIMQMERLKDRGVITKDLKKKCPYCIPDKILRNVLELKDHIQRDHPDTKRKCPKCGMAFILPQEVTHHIRKNKCRFSEPDLLDPMANRMLWHCSQCLYQTDSQAECFFHEALHSAPITTKGKFSVAVKYQCPLCHKYYRKQSLVHHVRQHTLEKPYRCSTCGSSFARPSSLAQHVKLKHEASEEFVCSVCDVRKQTKQSLMRHMIIHDAPPSDTVATASHCELPHKEAVHSAPQEHACTHPGCNYIGSTRLKLNRHGRIHGERVLKHQCSRCAFRSDQRSHLRRHLLSHQAAKPYKCPHCHFLCASLENLRKHVLKSQKHPGASLYICEGCETEFSTNLATEFRKHLTEAHSSKYNKTTAIQYVSRYCFADKNLILPTNTIDSATVDTNADSAEYVKLVKVENFRVTEDGVLEPYMDELDD